MTVTTFIRGSRIDVVRLALLSRGIILCAMILSDAIIPDHNPGDDVLRFDLRLSGGGADGNENIGVDAQRHCFCLEGHACDVGGGVKLKAERKRQKKNGKIFNKSTEGRACAAASESTFMDKLYIPILSPLTKWDGARFLSLAIDPAARIPKNVQNESMKRRDGISTMEDDDAFAGSEQAHAFFPLFPLCIRYGALILVRIVPSILLPSTFEGVAALSAMLLNLLCFVIAAVSMYDTTSLFLGRSLENLKQSEVERASYLVSALFCFNPASVFFTASYSESIFAALTFGGYALVARGLLWVALAPWILATYARSNGTFSSIWILLFGCGKVISHIVREWTPSANADVPVAKKIARVSKCAFPTIVLHVAMSVAVALPALYHERRGYRFHCLDQDMATLLPKNMRPSWCDLAEGSGHFSLYGYVQRRHWNVGFLRYYELKQTPNFLFASPVLAIGIMSTFCWIGTSWSRYLSAKDVGDKSKSRRGNYFIDLLNWAIFAMDESAQSEDLLVVESKRDVQEGDTPSVKIERALSAPYLLAHYAVFAGFCFVGATIAHVQVSTRLICSSCLALYWFLASLCFAGGERMVRRIQVYFALFNILGIVLHPNFLPWT